MLTQAISARLCRLAAGVGGGRLARPARTLRGRASWGGGRREEQHEGRRAWPRSLAGVGGAALAAGFVSYSGGGGGGDDNNNNNNNGDDGNSHLFEELHQAVLDNDERRLRALLKQCSPAQLDARHEMGWQLLHVAAVQGRARLCELLIQAGASVDSPDHYSSPTLVGRKLRVDPLLVALTREDQFLADLARGINYLGCTALHYAALANSLDTVELLARHGADPGRRNEQGLLAANLATEPRIHQRLGQLAADFERRQRELDEEERRRFPLEARLKQHLVGQEAAICSLAASVRRKQNGWFDEAHPLVFLFLGSSGVGKTELAKRVATYLHKEARDAFVRLDMSEYQEQHSVARMIGSPPGYVGHQEGGQLTEALRKCRNAVVLFDEVEKAHPKVLTVLLQLFDEGRLTDGRGKTIECKDAIFIMTSNLASEAIAQHALQLREEQQRARTGSPTATNHHYSEQVTISRRFKEAIVRPVLKAHFQRDEFLGRINEMLYFLPFSQAELRQLVVKELEFWARRAAANNQLQLTWDGGVVEAICDEYDVHYGARSIKHAVERRIINQLSELHFHNKRARRAHVSVAQELIHIELS